MNVAKYALPGASDDGAVAMDCLKQGTGMRVYGLHLGKRRPQSCARFRLSRYGRGTAQWWAQKGNLRHGQPRSIAYAQHQNEGERDCKQERISTTKRGMGKAGKSALAICLSLAGMAACGAIVWHDHLQLPHTACRISTDGNG